MQFTASATYQVLQCSALPEACCELSSVVTVGWGHLQNARRISSAAESNTLCLLYELELE